MNYKKKLNFEILTKNKTYFIADIAANHDGSLQRAKKLIRLCAKAGADAAKFQHFKAETIVSDRGFKSLGKLTHQKKWKESVFEVYKKASINPKWNKELKKECQKNRIHYMTAPYDLDYVDEVEHDVAAYKIGSGDINWKTILIKIAKKNKPVILASGASTLNDVIRAVRLIKKYNKHKLVLMQCNTNYTNNEKNLEHLNLNVISQYNKIFKKEIILGLSDHTQGSLSVLAAICLGAKVIEKHFTDNNNRNGPDHKFSMNPLTWKKMVVEARILEKALGDGKKKIELNEKDSSVVQRRGVWLKADVRKNQKLKRKMIEVLRPCPKNSIDPYILNKFIGKKFLKNFKKGKLLTKECLKR